MYTPTFKSISHVEKNFKKSKTCKNNHQNSENKIFAKTEHMTRSIQQATYEPNLKGVSRLTRPWLQKINLTYIWLLSRSNWPHCDKNQTQHITPSAEYKYQVSNWYIKACWIKSGKLERTDGQTLPWHNTSAFKRGAYKLGRPMKSMREPMKTSWCNYVWNSKKMYFSPIKAWKVLVAKC